MDVGAVDHPVRVAEALAEFLAHLDTPDFVGVDGVHHDQVVGEHRAVARRFADAEGIQGGIGVRAELDAGADLADLLGLFQQQHGDALLGECLGGGEATDAAADDDDGLLGSHASLLLPGRIGTSYWMKSGCQPGAACWNAGCARQWRYTSSTRG
ncbi:hypothetical protein D3C76_718670 [compost metagenome]